MAIDKKKSENSDVQQFHQYQQKRTTVSNTQTIVH